jgi:hypothetical protein
MAHSRRWSTSTVRPQTAARGFSDIPSVKYEDNHYRQTAGLTEDIPAEPSLH